MDVLDVQSVRIRLTPYQFDRQIFDSTKSSWTFVVSNHMKMCTKCQRDKDEEQFAWKYKHRGIRQAYCDECRRATAKVSYTRHRAKTIAKSVKRKRANISYFKSRKNELICCACSESTMCCLDFHHLLNKKFIIGVALRDQSKRALLCELEKCVVLCANCHRKVHDGMLQLSDEQIAQSQLSISTAFNNF